MIHIRPLDEHNLQAAIEVLDQEYGPEGPDASDPESFDSYQKWLPASIANDFESKKLLADYKIDYLKYWVGVDDSTHAVVAVTGVFTESDVPATAWLGWSNVFRPDNDFGHKWLGVEDAMIQFSAFVAMSIGADRLALYINEGEECESMSRLVDRHGFKEFHSLDKKKWENKNARIYEYDLGI